MLWRECGHQRTEDGKEQMYVHSDHPILIRFFRISI
jgi:hypothetical protein